MELSTFLDKEVYPYLDRKNVFVDLEPRDKGSYYLCKCPACGEHRGFVYKAGFILKCNRVNDCGFSRTLLEHISGVENPRGLAFLQGVQRLAALVGVEIPRGVKVADEDERHKKESLLESLFTRFQANLNDACKQYLTGRGFKSSLWFGTFKHDLLKMEEAEEAGFTYTDKDGVVQRNRSWEGRLMMPVRDRWGRMKGLVGRDITGKNEKKYLNTTGLEMQALGLVGLDQIKDGKVIVVEGLIDVFLARDQGITGVCAIGGSGVAMSPKRWELLASWGVKRVTLALDNDEHKAGRKGLIQAVKNTDQAMPCPDIFVVPPELHGDCKDLGEYVPKYGADAYMQMLEQKLHKDTFRAEFMAEVYNLDSQEGKVAYLEECLKLYALAPTKKQEHQYMEFFLPTAMQLSQTDPEAFIGYLEETKNKVDADMREKRLKELAVKVTDALAKGGYDEGLDVLTDEFEELQRMSQKQTIDKVVTVYEELSYHADKLDLYSGKDFIGLAQSTLPTLDKLTLGLRGLVTLSAASNVGKTILGSQLAMDVLATNPDACCIYISLEMTRAELVTRMKSRLMLMDWYRLATKATVEEKRESERRLMAYAKRMLILDMNNCPVPTVSMVLKKMAELKNATGCTRCIIIVDYLQVWGLPESKERLLRTDNDKDNYRMQLMKELRAAQNGDPIFMISETRKPDKGDSQWAGSTAAVRGSGRLVYGSDIILLMNPLSNEELVQNTTLVDVGDKKIIRVVPDYEGRDDDPPKPAELKKQAAKLRKVLKAMQQDYLSLEVAKVRDGGTRGLIMLTSYYQQSRFVEGLKENEYSHTA